jgi:hypothetical protein
LDFIQLMKHLITLISPENYILVIFEFDNLMIIGGRYSRNTTFFLNLNFNFISHLMQAYSLIINDI